MGLLDNILGGGETGGETRSGPGLGQTAVAGVALALVVKAVRSWQASHPDAPQGSLPPSIQGGSFGQGGNAGQYQGQDPGEGRSFDPQDQGQVQTQGRAQTQSGGGAGGLGGMLGGLLGGLGGGLGGMFGGGQGANQGGGIQGGGIQGGGLGQILSGLGGAGALGALVGQLRQGGLGQQVDSWIGHGQNQPVAPAQLESALGDGNVRQLEQQTGLGRQNLLQELSQALPEAVSAATPNGRLPETDEELHQAVRTPA